MTSKQLDQAWVQAWMLIFGLGITLFLSALTDSKGNKLAERLGTSLLQVALGKSPLNTWMVGFLMAAVFYSVSIGLYVITVAIGSHLGFSLAASTALWSGLVITLTTTLD